MKAILFSFILLRFVPFGEIFDAQGPPQRLEGIENRAFFFSPFGFEGSWIDVTEDGYYVAFQMERAGKYRGFVKMKNPSVVILNPQGRLQVQIARLGKGPCDLFGWPSFLSFDKEDGRIYAITKAQKRSKLVILEKKGEEILCRKLDNKLHDTVGKIKRIGESFLVSAAIHVTQKKMVFLHMLNKEGGLERSFFSREYEEDAFPYGCQVIFDVMGDSIYALSGREFEISLFDTAGSLLKTFGEKPSWFIDPPGYGPREGKWPLKYEKWFSLWTPVDQILSIRERQWVIVAFRTNGKVKGSKAPFLLNIYSRGGEMLFEGVESAGIPIATNKEGDIYFLVPELTTSTSELQKALVLKAKIR